MTNLDTPRWAPGAAGAHALRRAAGRGPPRRAAAPGRRHRHRVTADVYGAGEADRRRPCARRAARATRTAWSATIGHDFTTQRDGAKGFPRFTDPRCAAPTGTPATCAMATERSLRALRGRPLRRAAPPQPRSHRLHVARRSGRRWPRCATAGLTDADRRRPGPANGFTLDVIGCLERFGDADRLGDADPQPVRAVAGAAGAAGLRARRRARDRRASSTTAACSGTTCSTSSSSPSATTAASARRLGGGGAGQARRGSGRSASATG